LKTSHSEHSRSSLEELLMTLFDNLDSEARPDVYLRIEKLATEAHELATLDSIALLGFMAGSFQKDSESHTKTSDAVRAAEQSLILAHSCYELRGAARAKGGENESSC